jgi:hypothetical protein
MIDLLIFIGRAGAKSLRERNQSEKQKQNEEVFFACTYCKLFTNILVF